MIGSIRLVLIAAIDRRRVIGKEDGLPWHLRTDLRFFRQQTEGQTVVMGRKTCQSIGRPLPNRTVLVLTRDRQFVMAGVETVASLTEAAERVQGDRLMVAGGGEIYRLALPLADHLLLTHVDLDVQGDVFFPDYAQHFHQVEARQDKDKDTGTPLTFACYDRIQERV